MNGGNLSLGRYFGDGGRMIAYDGGLGMRMVRRTNRVFVIGAFVSYMYLYIPNRYLS